MLLKIPMNRFVEVEEVAAMADVVCVGGVFVIDRRRV